MKKLRFKPLTILVLPFISILFSGCSMFSSDVSGTWEASCVFPVKGGNWSTVETWTVSQSGSSVTAVRKDDGFIVGTYKGSVSGNSMTITGPYAPPTNATENWNVQGSIATVQGAFSSGGNYTCTNTKL
jgi:hypothetical protein